MRRLVDIALVGITLLTVFQTLGYAAPFGQIVESLVSTLALMLQVGGSPRHLQPAAWWVLFALVPVATRGVMMVRFRQHGSTQLKGAELNREGHRAFILALAGFSFTGLIGLAVLDQTLQQRLEVATLYLVVSFMAFMFALNMQSYKAHRWQDDLGTTATDVAILSMLLSVVAVLFAGSASMSVKLTAAIGLLVWAIDHWIRLKIEWRYRKELDVSDKDERDQNRGRNDSGWIKKSLDYDRCGVHGLSYPSGGECPACVRERNQQNRE